MRHTSERPAAPNYTAACTVMFGVNLLWMLVLVWAVWGFVIAALVGLGLHHLINRIATARG